MIIETARLILRPFKIEDVDDMYEYAKVKGIGEMAGWKHHQSKTESSIIVQNMMDKVGQEFAIELKDNHKVIGSIGIHIVNVDGTDKNQRELGYVISKDYHNQGIASEATDAIIKYCFEKLNIDVLWCMHFENNYVSKHLILKNGFVFHHIFEKEIEALDFKCFKIYAYYMDKEIYLANRH